MQAYTWTFTGDASGSPDAITLPQSFPDGKKRIFIRPPSGHAWSFYGVTGTAYPCDTDRELPLERDSPFQAGEVVGSVALDTGSGTFSAVAP